MSDLQKQVIHFHQVVGQPILGSPQVPDAARLRLRARLIMEESFETLTAIYGADAGLLFGKAIDSVMDAIGHAFPDPRGVNLAILADGLADMDFVSEGTRLECGIDGDPIAREVYRANMAKVGGPMGPDGKRLKPPGWTPPDIDGELDKQKTYPDRLLDVLERE